MLGESHGVQTQHLALQIRVMSCAAPCAHTPVLSSLQSLSLKWHELQLTFASMSASPCHLFGPPSASPCQPSWSASAMSTRPQQMTDQELRDRSAERVMFILGHFPGIDSLGVPPTQADCAAWREVTGQPPGCTSGKSTMKTKGKHGTTVKRGGKVTKTKRHSLPAPDDCSGRPTLTP